ncbi:NrsF family protein [Salipiger sp. H15]|uniref:NrsF family protein n=1 Tax=Alloyangia sp. H15 TaxID=3029062 RepID=A0AAU8AMZ7_9RHOB
MDTDELIAALAADDVPARRPRLHWRIAFGVAVSIVLMLVFWGMRPGWPDVLLMAPLLVKQALPLLVALAAWPILRRNDPEAQAPLWPLWLLAAASGAGWLYAALSGGDVIGKTLWQCLLSIPALALPIALALFLGMRHRVEPRPARSGMLAGLFAGGAAAAVYAVHCDEDSAAFFLLWYGLAIVLCGLAGRAAGRRWLSV